MTLLLLRLQVAYSNKLTVWYDCKREYGYYVLPILSGDRLVGRIEPLLDRKTGVLRVLGLWPQPEARAKDGPGIAVALRRLGGWLGATDLTIETPVPEPWTRALPT